MRLFIAVEFPDHVMAALTERQGRIRANVERGRFKHKDNFHLTLKFLGETPAAAVSSLTDRLSKVSRDRQPFCLRLGQAGMFGAGPPVRVIWQGLTGDLDKLHSLQQAVETECREIGFAPERRPYSPHITLAQAVTPLPGKPYLPQGMPELPFAVRDFALILSEEKDRKRVYTALSCFSLSGRT